jgi:hypothetical protein
MKAIFNTKCCTNCGSEELKWQCATQNLGGVQNNMISMNETGVIFFLGCEECSETVKFVDGDFIAQFLNNNLEEIKQIEVNENNL